jgi:hypothetical protein
MEPNRCGVWVPAFAGTTFFVLRVGPENEIPIRLSEPPHHDAAAVASVLGFKMA